MRDCLDQVGLGTCLCGIVFITSVDLGRPSPLRAAPSPGPRVPNCVRVMTTTVHFIVLEIILVFTFCI